MKEQNLIKSLLSYLDELLHVSCRVSPWEQVKLLPRFLPRLYSFFRTDILNLPCLLILPRSGNPPAPAQLAKHLSLIRKVWDGSCLFVSGSCPSYVRHRLIGQKIPFIVPGRQAYLPDLGIDLRSRGDRPQPNRKTMSPSTQAVVLHALLNEDNVETAPFQLSEILGYSRMTLTRALDELESFGIGEVYRKGKERLWVWKKGKQELWSNAEPYMIDPVRRRVWVKESPIAPAAGLSAVSMQSNLVEPSLPVFAMSASQCKEQKLTTVPLAEEASAEVEIWRYDPCLFAERQLVDPFSLHLSLRNDPDERTIAAINQIIGALQW